MLDGDIDVDVAVIGGGMAGVSIACELASTHSVVVLEQEGQLAHHSTGRSAAVFLESYGSPEVRALTRASRPLLDAAAVRGGTPLLTPRSLLWIAAPGREEGIAAMLDEQPGLQSITVAEARTLCPVLRADRVAAVASEPGAQDIDVAALHQFYLREARRDGVVVLTGSRLAAVAWDGAAWRLDLRGRERTSGQPLRPSSSSSAAGAVGHTRHASGEVVARVVVDAAGAWADQVAALLGARPRGLEPRRRTIAIGRPQEPLAPSGPLVADVDDTFYFRPDGPHVLVSPADETPSEPCDARSEEADVALAIQRVNEVTTLGIRSVVSTWAGLRTFAPDRNPVVGYDPEVSGLFWLAGQGGTGIQMAPALARVAADLLQATDAAAVALPPGLDLAAISPSRL